MPAPAVIRQLVERFEANLDTYRGGGYNETLLRRDFLDPFFKALGWDIDNSQDYAEAFREVIHEDAIKVGGSTKAPDYSFRIGGRRIFFLEAKKPSVYIKEEIAPAYQLRRYAWSANLPLSILSDFEEFAVYDCRAKPAPNDKPSKGRLLYLTYRDYLERWDEIAAVFSKEAVLKGSFDRYAREAKGKRGTATVDAEFLAQIEQWRDLLAKNLALRNPGIGVRELNFAVQATIDRIVFLRICEDRGIEPLNRLQGLANGAHIYERLAQVFREADERYNSGLFHFRSEKNRPGSPDEFTLGLKVDDKLLKDLLNGLYYPESPYEFSVLPADILGQVYERFLGSVIRLTAGGQAKVEEKPEVKKAGGVYYTPTYIVDYIVRQTVGRLLESQSPKDAARLKILDPACGSGSFLIGAYQHLLDWHLGWYTANDPEKHAKGKEAKLYRAKEGWRLTASERKRILVNNIYGVDIDAQAVEVTKLSLLLKVLEGETDESLNAQMKLFHERALPDLDGNIKCGNSLIGPDFFGGRLDLDEDERRRINAFDWRAEFPQVFKGGGFDAVIGNPPYVRQESLGELKDYFQSHYEAYDGVADLYAYFMEKGLGSLRDGGLFSIIVSSSFLRASYGRALREALKKHAAVLRLVDFGGLPVFANAKDTYVCIPLLEKGATPQRIEVARIASLENLDVEEYVHAHRYFVPQARFSAEAWSLKSDEEAAVFDKIVKAGKPLGVYLNGGLYYGIKTGLNEAFVIDTETRNRLVAQDKRSAELIKPLLGGEDIRRYLFRETGQWLIFTRRGVDIARYPAIRDHLAQWKEDLTPKKDKTARRGRKPGRYAWYEIQDDVAYFEVFDKPKIIFPDIAKSPRFSLDNDGRYLANTAYCIGSDDPYLLGVLNSRLFWFAISHISIPFGVRAGEYRYRLIYQYMEKVPIRVIDRKDKSDRARHDKLVALVEQMLKLHRDLAVAKTAHDKILVERQIAATDKQIDRLVYELYGLTEEEIAVVEGGA